MEKGIGRAGFRLLAFAFWTVGLGGLGLAAYAMRVEQTTFADAGMAVAFLALALLLVLAFSVPTVRPVRGPEKGKAKVAFRAPGQAKKVVKPPEPEPEPAPEEEPAPQPVAVVDEADAFEYDDYEPAPPAAPEQVVMPVAFQDQGIPDPPAPAAAQETMARTSAVEPPRPSRDPTDWPQRRTPARRSAAITPEPTGADPRFAKRYTQTTPLVRDIMGADDRGPQRLDRAAQPLAMGTEEQVTELVATQAPDDWDPSMVGPNQMVGQCGRCASKLIAPRDRPVRLTCPACGTSKLLS